MKKVIIYTTPSCTYCNMAKKFFTQNDISYEEKNVATDTAAREHMIQQSGQMGVPVIEVGKDIIVGFNRPLLANLLDVQE